MTEGIFDIKQAHKLDNPGRVRDLRPQELLKNMAEINKGNTCVDFGSGTGMFALPMAELVGSEGKVFAIDNSTEMLAYISAKNPPTNLTLLHSDVVRTGLDSQIADICLMASILHEIQEPGNLIAEAFRLLKSDGRLVIVEWKAELDSPGPPRKKRISKEQIMRFFSQTGLTLASFLDWSPNYYVALGKKVAAA
ncbi:class I SAM-dependent methyltransferase [Chloroflexota bacterium]